MPPTSFMSLRDDVASRRSAILGEFKKTFDSTATLHKLSDHLDEVIVQLVSACLDAGEVGVFALGGCGRRHVFPCSDVDLLFLIRCSDPAPGLRKGIEGVLGSLWDLHFRVGQQVWGLDDFKAIELDNIDFLLALLDARHLWGDSQWRDEQEAICQQLFGSHRDALLESIRDLTLARHRESEETIYQLEPDVKNSPGGLRDHLVARWVERLAGSDSRRLRGRHDRAFEFMARARIGLHILSGRDQNRMTHRTQEELAALLGFGRNLHSAAESLMKEYFLHARTVYNDCRRAIRRPGHEQMVLAEPPADLEATLRVFEDLKKGGTLSPEAAAGIHRSVARLSENPSFSDLRESVWKLLLPHPNLYRVLSEMFELGILELLFPEFGTIRARVIRDFYHRYTVDEHSLLAVKAICDLLHDSGSTDERFRELLLETEDSQILTLALLLHDVGKSRAGSHVEASSRMASRALRRFHFPKKVLHRIDFLIREHLTMSQLAFRRNIDDPATVKQLADAVPDVAALRLLTLLTFADVKAVAPQILTEWKRDLLWQLYVRTYSHLTRGFGQAVIHQVAEQFETEPLPADVDREDIKGFLQGLPQRYLMNNEKKEILAHYRMGRRMRETGRPQLRLRHSGAHYELCVVAADRRNLFARIVGVLSYFGLNILRGHALSNRQKIILDIFEFDDPVDVLRRNPSERRRCVRLLRKAILGRLKVSELLRARERSFLLNPITSSQETGVYFDEQAVAGYTIMEIIAADSVGLLYRISREISAIGCNIELALISTEGMKAIDVFYLTMDGEALCAETCTKLKNRIIEVVGGVHENGNGNHSTQ